MPARAEYIWSKEEDRILEREWRAGTVIKRIAEYLPKRTVRAIHDRRMTLGLPRRGRPKSKSVDLHISVPRDLHTKLSNLAAGRGMSANAYMIRILRRDVGE